MSDQQDLHEHHENSASVIEEVSSRLTRNCPVPERMEEFAQGQLRGWKRHQMQMHLRRCDLCADTVSILWKMYASERAANERRQPHGLQLQTAFALIVALFIGFGSGRRIDRDHPTVRVSSIVTNPYSKNVQPTSASTIDPKTCAIAIFDASEVVPQATSEKRAKITEFEAQIGGVQAAIQTNNTVAENPAAHLAKAILLLDHYKLTGDKGDLEALEIAVDRYEAQKAPLLSKMKLAIQEGKTR